MLTMGNGQFWPIFSAMMTALTIAGGIGYKFFSLMVDSALQKAVSQLSDNYILSMKSDITGAEIQRYFEEYKVELGKMRKDMDDAENSRVRHEKNNAETIQLLATQIAVMRATSHFPTSTDVKLP